MSSDFELTQRQLKQTFGDSGTSRYGGYFQEEPNTKWRDEDRVDNVETMRRTDGAVKAVLNAIKAPILSTQWRIETTDDSAQSEKIRQFVEDTVFQLKNRSWRDFIREAFAYQDFGHYVFEKIYDIKDGRIVLVDLEPRIPRSIFNWLTKDGERGITQLITTDEVDESMVSIPEEKLFILTNEKEGDDVTGQSVLRSAYKHFKFKDTLYRISGIAAERYGVGVPTVKMPQNYSSSEKEEAEEMVKNLRSNEKNYMVLPHGFELDIKTPDGNPMGTQIETLINHHNKMILTSVLAQFLGLGQDGVGSFALSKDQSSFFLKHVEDKANYFIEQFDQQIIKDIVIRNYGKQKVYPKLRFTPLGDIDFKEMSEVMNVLTMAGLVDTDTEIKQWTRQTFKLPEMTQEQMESDEETSAKIKKKELKHSLNEQKFDPFRPLTLQEERADLRELNETFNDLETELEQEMAGMTNEEMIRYTEQAQKKIEAGDIAGITALSFLFYGRLRKILNSILRRSLDKGKNMASAEINVERPTTPKNLQKLISSDTQSLSRAYINELERSTKSLMKDAIATGASPVAIGSAVKDKTRELSSRMITNLSGTVVGQYINRGRNTVFEQNLAKIQALQRSEVLDSRTCNICLSLDQRVIKPDDPIAQMDIVHSHCRGVWTSILISDTEKPKVTGIPKTVMDNFETVDGKPIVNSYKQLKKPINKANKEAQQEIQKRLE